MGLGRVLKVGALKQATLSVVCDINHLKYNCLRMCFGFLPMDGQTHGQVAKYANDWQVQIIWTLSVTEMFNDTLNHNKRFPNFWKVHCRVQSLYMLFHDGQHFSWRFGRIY